MALTILKKEKLPLTSRLTKQRQVIMDVLSKAKCHMSAREIFTLVKKQMPRISFATVYRNLKFLADNKYVSLLESSKFGTFYEAYKSKHNHFICDRCQSVYDMSDTDLVKLHPPLKSSEGHKILSYCFTTRGVCKKCNRSRAKVKKYVKKIIPQKS